MDCIFCKIVNGDIPAYKVYENDKVLGFLDISQTTKGHTLLIPKKHVANLYELSSEDASEIFSVVPMVANALKKAFKPIGLNLVNNTEKPLQTVNHFHIHLLPRYSSDSLQIGFANYADSLTKEDYLEVTDAIVSAIKKT